MTKPIVAVIGNGTAPPEIVRLAETTGAALVEHGYRVLCGGLGGVMEAACRGARNSPEHTPGDVIGILPGDEPGDANPFVDIAIATGLGVARNVVVAHADAVVAIGGGAGTLSEMAIAWQLDRPIVAIVCSGWSGRLAGERIDGRRREVVNPDDDRVHPARDALEVIEHLARLLESRD